MAFNLDSTHQIILNDKFVFVNTHFFIPDETNCPAGFFGHAGHCFKFIIRGFALANARGTCRMYNAFLLHALTDTSKDFLATLVTESVLLNKTGLVHHGIQSPTYGKKTKSS